MNNKLISALVSIGLVLILLIIGEWWYAKQAQTQLLAPSNATDTKKYPLDEMPIVDLTQQSEDSYDDLVARPLFVKGRRPVEEPTPLEKQGIASAAVKFDWVLNGVYTQKKALFALFSRTTAKIHKDNFSKKTLGDDLDGWKLTEIHKDKALLTQGAEEKVLLLRKPKLKELPKIVNANPNAVGQQNQPNPIPVPEQGIEPGQEADPELQPDPESEEETFENSDNEQF